MADRLSSDHPSVETVRTTCTDSVTARHLEIAASDSDSIPTGDVVRIALDGTERFTVVKPALEGSNLVIPGLFETPGKARDSSVGDEYLSAWLDETEIPVGGSVLLDIVEPDFYYGLRAPGETVYYDASEPPADSLQAIAKNLEGDADR